MRNAIITILILGIGGLCFGQQVSGDSLLKMLEHAKSYYNGGEYEQAITELEKALQFLKQLNQIDQVEAYKYLAFSYVAFGDKEKAKEQFRLALKLEPDMELDPSTVSPKIIKVFEEVKAEVVVAPPVKPPVTPPVKPPVTPPVKPPAIQSKKSPILAAGMSCCLPGLGQMYRGEKKTGTTLLIMTGATYIPFLVSAGIAEKKHQQYLDVPPDDTTGWMDRAYKSYRTWCTIRGVTGTAAVGVWLYNLYDIIFTKPPVKTSWGLNGDGFYCNLDPERMEAGYRIGF